MNHHTNDRASYTGYRALMLVLFGPSGQPPAWRLQAACADRDTETFFDHDRQDDAVTVCAGCPVAALCRADQLAWETTGPASRRYYAAGVVGGLTGTERQAAYYAHRHRVTDRKGVA